MATTALVIAIATGSGAATHSAVNLRVSRLTPAPVHHCTARQGLRFYTSRLNYWRGKMGAGRGTLQASESGKGRASAKAAEPGRDGNLKQARPQTAAACPRYLAKLMRSKAHAARKAYGRWLEHEWHWELWLPDKFARVGACETGYGRRPGSWTWDTRIFRNGRFIGGYVSAFGIYAPAYEQYHRWTGHNTPREQYEVAAAIQARYGWGAWGCAGA